MKNQNLYLVVVLAVTVFTLLVSNSALAWFPGCDRVGSTNFKPPGTWSNCAAPITSDCSIKFSGLELECGSANGPKTVYYCAGGYGAWQSFEGRYLCSTS